MFLMRERRLWRLPLSRTAAVDEGSQQVEAGAKAPNFNHRRFPRTSACCSEVPEKVHERCGEPRRADSFANGGRRWQAAVRARASSRTIR